MSTALTRRSALRGLAVSAAAGVVGFVVARSHRTTGRGARTAANSYGAAPSGGRLLVALAKVPRGGGLVIGDAKIVLTRVGDTPDAVLGFSAICTHQGCLVDAVTRTAISCPCHGSTFDPTTGAVTGGPATRPLATVGVEVRGGDIYQS